MALPEPTITPKQLARAIGVSESSVKRWCDAELIETVRTAGGHRRLLRQSALAYLKRAGHSVVGENELDLPTATGSTGRLLRRGCRILHEALVTGDAAVALRTVLDLRDAAYGTAGLLDHVIVPAVQQLRDECEASAASQGVRISLDILHRLRSEMDAPAASATTGLVAGLDGTLDSLQVSGVCLTLANAGYRSVMLGTGLPFFTLKEALLRYQPLLLFVTTDQIRNEREFVRQFALLRRVARRQSTRIIVGVSCTGGQFLESLKADHQWSSFAELEDFARRLRKGKPGGQRS